MSAFTLDTWVLLGIVGLAGALGILYTLAQAFAHEQRVHDLKLRVSELRRSYSRRLAEIGQSPKEADELIEAVPVSDEH